MSLILTTGKYKEYKTFITNRFLRLYPIYFAIAALTLLLSFFLKIPPIPQYLAFGNDFAPLTWLYMCFSNLTLVAQEASLFMGLQNGHLYNIIDFHESVPWVCAFFLVPQAWSLSVELMFYVIAPALLWQKKNLRLVILTTLIILSIVCRIWLILAGMPYDPWAYRFFPSVIYLFLLGSLMHHFYGNYLFQRFEKIKKHHVILCGSMVALAGICYKAGIIPHTSFSLKRYLEQMPAFQETAPLIAEIVRATIPYAGYGVFICVLFYFTCKNRLDRFIGELSYPVYVVHMLVMNVLVLFVAHDHLFPYWVVGISLLVSAGLVKWVQNPIERYRMARLKARNTLLESSNTREQACTNQSGHAA